MKCFVSLLLLLAFFGVNSYDFDDRDFNEHLLNELQSLKDDDLYTDLLQQRTRRDADVEGSVENDSKKCAKPSWRKDMHCCKGSNAKDEHVADFHNKKKECVAELKGEPADDAYDPFNCEQMQLVKQQIICIGECVAKKFESIDENGLMKRDIILEHLRKQVDDEEWKKDAVEGYVDKCLAEVKEKREQHEKEGKVSEGCSIYPLAFQNCMWRQFWNGCPAELHVDTPRCNKLRGRLAEGNTAFFRQHFLYKYYPMGSD